MAYRTLIYLNGTRGQEEKESIYVQDIEKITACTDEEVLDESGVAPESYFSPGKHGESIIPSASGGGHGSRVGDGVHV